METILALAWPDWIAIAISAFALIVAVLSWRASIQATRAAIYERRYEVYADAEKFISAWLRDGRPDMDELRTLVGAWSRSHFLFDEKVTVYLRKIWTDAVDADYANKVIAKKAQGDRSNAIEKASALHLEHADYDKLRAVFMDKLKVKP